MSTKMVEEVYRAVSEVLNDLKGYRGTNPCRYFQGPARKAPDMDFDDSGWQEVNLPHSWDARRGEAWFRREILVPPGVEGIDVTGSVAELSSFVMFIGTEVYVNGKRIFFAPYWADLRGPKLMLSKSVKPGDRFVVAIHAFSKEGLAAVPAMVVEYSAVEDLIFELEATIEALRFVSVLEGRSTLEGRSGVAGRAADAVDLDALYKRDWERVRLSLRQAREILKEKQGLAKSYTIHMVGHAHIDMNWLWPWEDTLDVVRRDFETVTRIMDDIPDFRFSQSQAFLYKTAEEKFPHLFERIQEKIRSGQWEVTASTWVEGDLNMARGESIARHLLYSKRYLMNKFGVEPRICWEPDTFGHPWTLPQILKKTGIDYYYHMRAGKGIPLYWWEGPDGSRVMAFNEPNTYNNVADPAELIGRALMLKEEVGVKDSLIVYGVGDHGGGPTRAEIAKAKALDGEPGFPHVKLSRAVDFFDAVAKENPELPVVRDELNFVFDGCYTTHADIKRHNRRCENLLLDAETFAAISSLMGSSYPYDLLWKAWDITLFNQFHDILDGSAIGPSYRYSDRLARSAEEYASAVIRQALLDIAKDIPGKGVPKGVAGVPIVVFNSLGWDRTDVVTLPTAGLELPEKPVIKEADGTPHPVQLAGDKLIFVAPGVPSLGYKVFYLCNGDGEGHGEGHGYGYGDGDGCGDCSWGLEREGRDVRDAGPEAGVLASAQDWRLENEYLSLKVDPDSGCLTEVYDKAARRMAMTKERQPHVQPVYNNLLQVLYEVPHDMSAWIIGGISRVENLIRGAQVELVEAGPVRGAIRVTHHVGHSTISQEITIYRGIKRVDFVTEIDWREESGPDKDAPMLKAAFTPDIPGARATFEIPYGYIERPADGREVPALRWVDLSNDEYGVSLLNDSKYGFDVSGNTMRITLLRTSYEPDPHPDQGLHRFVYSIYPHEGDWREAGTPRRGEEVNRPLLALPLTGVAGELAGESLDATKTSETAEACPACPEVMSLPESRSFVRVNPGNAMISAFKRAEDDNGLVIRVYESEGREADVEVLFGFNVSKVTELDIIERPVPATMASPGSGIKLEGGTLRFHLAKHEICTFLLQ
ncbi:MAG: alpha-mannosidase [Firmicutes bacterium]|nr:alpha-mannosidase [Bacillota bacterium]